jgi:hypothetical protein
LQISFLHQQHSGWFTGRLLTGLNPGDSGKLTAIVAQLDRHCPRPTASPPIPKVPEVVDNVRDLSLPAGCGNYPDRQIRSQVMVLGSD